jgi:hypothetical protein
MGWRLSRFHQSEQAFVFSLILTFIRVILGAEGNRRDDQWAQPAMIGTSIPRMFPAVRFQGTSGAASIEWLGLAGGAGGFRCALRLRRY